MPDAWKDDTTVIPILNTEEDGARIRATVRSDGAVEIQPLLVGTPYKNISDAMCVIDGLEAAIVFVEQVLAQRNDGGNCRRCNGPLRYADDTGMWECCDPHCEDRR